MTAIRNGVIWVRGTDLERLFAAPRICYLVGSYDGSGNYGDILQLHANVKRLQSVGGEILAAPMVYWKHATDHDSLCDKHPWLFRASCFLYYVPADELEEAAPELGDLHLVDVPAPPPTFSQTIVYGGGFFNSWWNWGSHKLKLLNLLSNWLGDVSPDSHPLAVVGQQISSNFLTSPNAEDFAALLDNASMIGVRDELSLENLRRWNKNGNVNSAMVSGDDATLPIIAAREDQRPWSQSDFHVAQRPAGPPVINIHLNTNNYVTDDPYKLVRAFESIVRGMCRVAGDALTLNLLIAYDDSRISEWRVVNQLKASPAAKSCTINVVSCIDEVQQGFPNIGRANLTISCSYHVALTSLLLGIPTAFAFSNEYYWHKAEGLKRAFHLPDAMLLDIRNGSHDDFTAAITPALCDETYRARLSEAAARGAAGMVLLSTTTSNALSTFMTIEYEASHETRYREVAAKLLETSEQLSDLRLEYGRLLNSATKLSAARWSKPRSKPHVPADAYEETIDAIREFARANISAGAKVLVVSRGDEDLLDLGGHTSWHFPQSPNGQYAGHHPADSAAAVEHLGDLCARGAEYLVLPNTAFWWLDHYKGFADHLNQRHEKILDGRHCIVYRLAGERQRKAPSKQGPARKPKKAPLASPNGRNESQQEPDPIIVYGPPRSGTTYLIEILNRHPEVFISSETRLFVWAHRTLNVETHEFYSLYNKRAQFIDHLREQYPDLIRDFYRKLSPNTRYWGDKNPHYASPDSEGCLQTIVDLFPGARFINIIRDGRGTVASVLRKGWEDFETAHRWSTAYSELGSTFGKRLPAKQYFELRYEDLIHDDTAMARRLFEFLEIDIHPEIVSFCDAQKVNRTAINHPERDLNGDLTQSDWSSVLTSEQQAKSIELLSDQLVTYGYETKASVNQLQSELLHAATPGLAGTVRDVLRGALLVGGNGNGRTFSKTRREEVD